MQEKLRAILEETLNELSEITDMASLQELRVRILGKKGALTGILRGMGGLPPEERPEVGRQVNEVRARIEESIARREEEIEQAERIRRMAEETLDVTVPGTRPPLGGLHPLTLVTQEIEDIFVGLGFAIAEGPEIEYERYNFELLNVPRNHPARDMQDSFYITDSILLRTQTSPVQARTMLRQKPPIRLICPGRVYRIDEVDATHSPVFHQMEGLVVDRGIHMGHLRGLLDTFAKEFFGEKTRTRLRPSFFPFTEPSAEVDVSCYLCDGSDPSCRVCRGGGWVEILGCGMVNPRVLTMCGIDPDEYSGFAFGLGLDRITVSRYGISDLRTLFENDMRFLSQFRGGI
ncbi:MAG: phenylalanine--tRNA ligase subunit alpha [Christensenellales bacterium]|jgi:phenylalanyl-tRNA synthetase alpha chain